MDRDRLQKDIWALYERKHAALGEQGTNEHLERGRVLAERFDLAETLRAGGVLVFPHAGVNDCGYQIAACVQAALDSGADTVLVVSVLHAFNEAMQEARERVADGEDPAQFPSWGVQGPGLRGRDDWTKDHALMSFRHFWNAEVKRRGLKKPPRVLERYPYLSGGKPEALPGIEELRDIAKNAAVLSTADAFHHGLGYGDPPQASYEPDERGLAHARSVLEEGVGILEKGDYWAYNQHCVAAKSDARDAGQVFRYLRGPMNGRILELTYSDAADLYQAPRPTWVAAALYEWRLEPGRESWKPIF